MKHSELRQIIMEEIEAALAEDNMKKGRRFIPTIIPFPKSIRDQFPEHFKLVKNAEGEYKLYISPMMKVSLEGIQRGRTSQDTRSRAGDLVNKLSDKIPTSVRAILKNFSPKLNTSVGEKGMYPVNSKISDVTNGDINFFNPSNPATSDKAYDPIISEAESPEPDSVVSKEARDMFYNAVAKIVDDLYKAGIKDDDIITLYLSEDGGLLGDAIEASYHS